MSTKSNENSHHDNWNKTLAVIIDYVQSDSPQDANILIKRLYGDDFFLGKKENNTHYSKIIFDLIKHFL